MKILFVFLLIIAFAQLINFDYVLAESLHEEISFPDESLNNLSINMENDNELLDGSKVDNDIFGDEQTFPFVAGLGKNAAH